MACALSRTVSKSSHPRIGGEGVTKPNLCFWQEDILLSFPRSFKPAASSKTVPEVLFPVDEPNDSEFSKYYNEALRGSSSS